MSLKKKNIYTYIYTDKCSVFHAVYTLTTVVQIELHSESFFKRIDVPSSSNKKEPAPVTRPIQISTL